MARCQQSMVAAAYRKWSKAWMGQNTIWLSMATTGYNSLWRDIRLHSSRRQTNPILSWGHPCSLAPHPPSLFFFLSFTLKENKEKDKQSHHAFVRFEEDHVALQKACITYNILSHSVHPAKIYMSNKWVLWYIYLYLRINVANLF